MNSKIQTAKITKKIYFFTLIELFVVISLILVLSGFLFSAVNKVIKESRSMYCMNNLKQISIILTNYTTENRLWTLAPYAKTSIGHWSNYIYVNHVQANNLFKCPSLPDKSFFSPPGGTGIYDISIPVSYIINACKNGSGSSAWGTSSIAEKENSFGWTSGFYGSAKYTLPIRLSQVTSPASTIWITETPAEFANLSPANRANAGKYIDRFKQTDHGLTITGTTYANYRNVGKNHNNRFNVLFGDIHIKSMPESKDSQWVAYRKP